MIRIGSIVIDQLSYPDNTLLMHLPEQLENGLVIWNYENDAELFSIICIRKHYKHLPLSLYLPYVPHARMDRVKAPTDVFTLKYFCETINDLDFAAVYIEDPHSNVSEALLDRVQVVSPQPHIETVIEKIADENLVMCYPDEGAMKRYSGMVSKPYSFGVKRRNWADGKIEGLDLMHPEVVVGKNVLSVDDICSRGGTFFHTAKALKDAGAEKVYLYVTHCETTIFNGDLLSSCLGEKIYTTYSIIPGNAANEMIEII